MWAVYVDAERISQHDNRNDASQRVQRWLMQAIAVGAVIETYVDNGNGEGYYPIVYLDGRDKPTHTERVYLLKG